MATDNYLKVRRPGTTRAVEFFFDSRHDVSRVNARLAASAYADEITAGVRAKDADADPAVISVFEHGAPGLGDLPCVGGCDICAPRTLEVVEGEGDEVAGGS